MRDCAGQCARYEPIIHPLMTRITALLQCYWSTANPQCAKWLIAGLSVFYSRVATLRLATSDGRFEVAVFKSSGSRQRQNLLRPDRLNDFSRNQRQSIEECSVDARRASIVSGK